MLYISYGKIQTNPNNIESKRSSGRCFQDHNLRPPVTILCTHSAISFFFPDDFFFCTAQRGQFTHQNFAIKNIGHHACLRENDDISLSREPSRKGKILHFVHVRALTTRKILRRRDA